MKKTYTLSMNSNEKLNFFSNFSTLLGAGISILEAVDSLRSDAKGPTKKILDTMHEDLLSGKNVSVSFSRFPKVFSPVMVSVMKAAEEGGNLAVTLKDLRKQLMKEIEFRDKVRSALMYPAVVVVVMLGIFLLILVEAIPRIATVFTNLHMQLPLPTRILISLSNILLHDTLFVVGGTIILISILLLLIKKRPAWALSIFYKLPIVSDLILQIDLTQFSRNVSLLLHSGVTITSALELSSSSVVRPDVAHAIAYAHARVSSGEDLSSALKKYKRLFPSVMVKIIEAGEQTGTLDTSLQDICEFLEYKVTNSLKTLTTLLEPILLVVVGIVVGSLMLSIIGPIYNLIGQVSPH